MAKRKLDTSIALADPSKPEPLPADTPSPALEPPNDAQHEWVMERARMMLTRGTPRQAIFTKLKLTPAQQEELLEWGRATTGRKR